MERHFKREAIVLKYSDTGEQNRFITLFTPDEGLIRATAFGARSSKSTLRASTRLFQYGIFSLYRDPSRPFVRITDADIKLSHDTLHEDICGYFAACVWAEIILASHGGGSGRREVFRLLILALSHLTSREETGHYLPLHIKVMAVLMAVQGDYPDLQNCSGCSTLYKEGEPLYYRRSEQQFLCAACSGGRGSALTGETAELMRHIMKTEWTRLSDKPDLPVLMTLLTERWEYLLGRRLKSAEALRRLV